MFELDKWVVPELLDAKEYSLALGELSVEQPELARMCLNENPLLPSEKVIEALAEGGRHSNRYPDARMSLRRKIGGMFGFSAENVFLGNGSSETIDSMMRAFLKPGDEVILPAPTFSLFNVRASVVGANIVGVPFVGDDLQYDADAVLAAVTDKTKLIVIVTPNNPTGAFMPEEGLRRILDRGIPTCIDEAYLEFHRDVPSLAKLVGDYPNAFCSHTLSKAYGLAGIRFGYLIARPEVVGVFERLSLPWNLSYPTVLAAEAALDDEATLARNVEFIQTWIQRFAEVLREKGCRPINPAGNYMLVHCGAHGKTTREIYEAGLKENLILKTAGPINGRDGYFRVTPGTVEENERAIRFFENYFGG